MVRLLCCLAMLSACAAAEVTLDLPDPIVPGVALDGVLNIVDATADAQRVDLPPVEGLEWQLSRRNSQRTTITNGRQSSVISVGLVVRAAQVGTLQLPPVTVHFADGSQLKTAARALHVAPGDPALTGDAVASCRFDPPAIVPGQPTSLVYRLCLRRGEVSKLGVGPPEGAIALGERTIDQGRTFDAQGREWKVVTVTWPITHATPGTYPVSGQQELQIQIGDGFFDNRVQRRQVAIAPATLTVEALPTAGRPDGYYGLIGPIALDAKLDRERVAAGEGTQLAITITGRQTDLAKRPVLAVAGAQLYPKDDTTAEGSRTFRWDVVPAVPGSVAIPAVHVPYFDPGSRSYRIADSAALTLSVLPGRSRDLGIVGAVQPGRPAPEPAAAPQPLLPPPLRGQGGSHPPPWMAPAALAAGLAGSLAGFALRIAIARRGPHRGRMLRAAAGDPATLAAALAALRPALATPDQRQAADALQDALDQHRFGGRPLPDLDGWLRILEAVR